MPITKGHKALVAEAMAQVTTYSVSQVMARLQAADRQLQIVDIRDVRELQAEGMVTDSYHAPRCMLEFWVDPESPYFKKLFADEGKEFVLFCGAGWRSALAAIASDTTLVAVHDAVRPFLDLDTLDRVLREADQRPFPNLYAAGREIATLVGQLANVEPHLMTDAKRETTIKTRYVAGSQQLLRADRETVSEVSPAIADDIARVVAAAIGDCGVLVLSDYAKGVLTAPSITAMIAAAHRAGKPVLVDPKGYDYTRYRGATLLTPNRRELAEAVQ